MARRRPTTCAAARRTPRPPFVTDAHSALDAVESALPDDFVEGVLVLPLHPKGATNVAIAVSGPLLEGPGNLPDVLLAAAAESDLTALVVALVHDRGDLGDALGVEGLLPWIAAFDRLRSGGLPVPWLFALHHERWIQVRVRFEVPD